MRKEYILHQEEKGVEILITHQLPLKEESRADAIESPSRAETHLKKGKAKEDILKASKFAPQTKPRDPSMS